MASNVIDPVLQSAAALARAGRMAEACDVAERGLADRDDPVLYALAGTIRLRLEQFDRAALHLAAALDARPTDVTVRANLADAYLHLGRSGDALALCTERAAAADPSFRLWRLRAHLAQDGGDFETAVDAYAHVVRYQPDDWASLNNLGNALTALERFDDAADVLAKAAQQVPDSAPVQLNYAAALNDAGRLDEAEQQYRTMADRFPLDPKPSSDLFLLYKRMGREEESLAALREAVARDPDSAPLRSDLGQECAWRNFYDEAEESFEQALAIEPTLSPSYVGLASVYERTNREAELQSLLDRAQSNDADPQTHEFIRSLILKRTQNFPAALEALSRVGDVVIPARRFNLRGQLLERTGQSDAAFEAFAAMNREWLEDPSQPRERAAIYREMVKQGEQRLTADWIGEWGATPPPLDRPTPVFLVGFPRSGTTLLDTLLMGHPAIQVLEEEAFIGEAERELGGNECLATAGVDEIVGARSRYFARVAEKLDLRPDSLIVDKHPLHLNKVPVIRRLFPDARFILAMRHPCDVLLSCFITNFRLNNAMVNFLDLGDAAKLYDLTFRFWEKSRAVIGQQVHTIVYERMVEDPARELRPLIDWLGLEWTDQLLDHRSTAIARGPVSTASYSQVTEPIYKRAAGRWTRYRTHLEPILPLLAPWVDRFGYSLDDGRHSPWPTEEARR